MTTSRIRTGRSGSPRLSLTARAVRAALFASAFAMAPTAFAGTCVQTATNEVTCSGAFTDDVNNSIPPANHVPNLTLILDDTTTVDPATGVNGLTANWGGDVTVTSYADINTDGADGIFMYGSTSSTLGSYGDIYTYVSALGANAIDESALGATTATLGGTITATGEDGFDVLAVRARSYAGDASIVSSADINANSYDADANALYVSGFDNASVYNSGIITATASYGDAYGVEAYAYLGDVYFNNANAIAVTGYNNATGALAVSTNGDVNAYNSGDISATASGDVNVYATGLQVSGYNVYVNNSGSIEAYATANATLGSADATALMADGVYTNVYNTGSLYAYANANGYGASATGADLNGTSGLYVYNGGDISAVATGDVNSRAVGLYGTASGGNITLVNDGSISATADDTAIGVELYSNGYTYLTNNGTISADGGYYGTAIDTSGGVSTDYIANYGTITGAIYTGAGDDVLYNGDGATWNATGYSDFGAGDDTVLNYGTINMDNSFISMGTYATAAGNLFQNSGTISANGDNYVDVGAGGGLSGSLFVNDGVIDMQDGHANDTFTVYGDFAGTGDVNVDVEGDAGVSDMLYIDGNVAADARQTINVDLIDLSAPIADTIPIVEVTGDSTAANFALGDVGFDPNTSFVNLGFSLIADIDATNATPDVFSLGIAVTGLTDTGTIASAVAPAAASLIQTEVGTWRQRQGVIDSYAKGGIGLWARVFTEKTNFGPDFESDDIGLNGNFDWKQKNRGVEAGIDFSVTDDFAIGLLVAKSKASVDLDPGNASADLDADTWGIYGTWLSPEGFYLDASYRWTKFDTDLDTPSGALSVSGAKAETFNIELGYAWTLADGLKIEPQFQWTKTNVKNIDVFTIDSSGMTFTADNAESSRGRLGVAVYKGFGDADSGWKVTPYAALSAVREFDGENDFAINDTLFGRTHTDGTSALLELAVTARHENVEIWGGLNWQDGGSINNSLGGQLGVRYTFGGQAPVVAPPPPPPPPAKTCADLDDDNDGVNNCDDKCPSQVGVAPDGCPAPAPAPEPEPAPKPYRG